MLGLFRKNKALADMTLYTESLGIDEGFAPKNIYLEASEVCVSENADVRVGDTLGYREDKSAVFSGISGKVAEITPCDKSFVLKIENDFLSRAGKEMIPFGKRSTLKASEISADDLVSEINRAGISSRMRSITPESRTLSERILQANGKAKQIILSCADCEPCDSANSVCVSAHGSDIINGMKIIMSALKIGEGVIVLPTDSAELAKELEGYIKDTDNVKILLADLKYPCDNEHLVIHALTSIEISAYKNAERVACAVFDGREALGIARAFIYGEKETGEIVTVSGDISDPINARIPYGTKFSEIISYCGKDFDDETVCTAGGLLRGRAVSEDETFDRSMSPIVVLSSENIPEFSGKRCVKCGECASVCPMMLLPSYLWRAKSLSSARAFDIDACIECGACQYSCPEMIPILDNIRKIKSKEGAK